MKPSHGGLCLVLVALLAACENTDSSKPNGDWVARVNAGGVTNKQIDFELAQNPKLRQSDPDSVGKLVVRQLAQQELLAQKEEIQCVISTLEIEGAIKPGNAQCPGMGDYADGVDTMAWLLKIQGSNFS